LIATRVRKFLIDMIHSKRADEWPRTAVNAGAATACSSDGLTSNNLT